MQHIHKRALFLFLIPLLCLGFCVGFAQDALAVEQRVLWGKNYGSSERDGFFHVVELPDNGFIMVGSSAAASSNIGDGHDWGNEGEDDAVAARIDEDGSVLWARNYGGAGSDMFLSSTLGSDGFLYAVGSSNDASTNLGNNNWGTENADDGIVVKLNIETGDVVWARNYGGNEIDGFSAITCINDSIYIAGNSYGSSTNLQDNWSNEGEFDAIVVKVDMATGNDLWAKNYGGDASDSFFAIIESQGKIYAAGSSIDESTNLTHNWDNEGDDDAIVVCLDPDTGADTWSKNYGSTSADSFSALYAADDGIYAIGSSAAESVNLQNNWGNEGSLDAVVVKIHTATREDTWAMNYGGSENDIFLNAAMAHDGLYVSGYSEGESTNLATNWGNEGDTDALIVKLDVATGNDTWAHNYGGFETEQFNAIAATESAFFTVGFSNNVSTNLMQQGAGSEWDNEGNHDALVMKSAFAYALTVENGTDITNAGPYFPGTKIAITAHDAPAEQTFDTWVSDAGVSFADESAPATTFFMPERDVKVTATYKPIISAYRFTINVTDGGIITEGTGGDYAAGSVIPVAAQANEGYVFKGWETSAGGSFGNKNELVTSFTMPSNDVEVTAVFEAVPIPKPNPIPQTGDGSTATCALGVLTLLSVVTIVIVSRKKAT